MKEAIQWWYQKKLRQLKSEANLIREQLLQESFAMRRSLELTSMKSDKFAPRHQKYVEQLENFHSSLKQLSDRLDPPYLNEALPLALQHLVKRWREQLPEYQFRLNLPQKWQPESSADDFMVLNILEDLLNIQKPHTLSNNLIAIDLEHNSFMNKFENQLRVMFAGEKTTKSKSDSDWRSHLASRDRVKGDIYGNCQELQYLQQTFESLTSGSCSNILTEDSDVWLFNW